MSNKSTGTKFEKEFAAALADHWFWVHLFQDNQNGQPCDVVAARNGETYLFDCKECQGEFFLLKRMEENQYNAMKLFELAGNGKGMFAIRFRKEKIFLIEYDRLEEMRTAGFKRINETVCRTQGKDLEEWFKSLSESEGWEEDHADHHWK